MIHKVCTIKASTTENTFSPRWAGENRRCTSYTYLLFCPFIFHNHISFITNATKAVYSRWVVLFICLQLSNQYMFTALETVYWRLLWPWLWLHCSNVILGGLRHTEWDARGVVYSQVPGEGVRLQVGATSNVRYTPAVWFKLTVAEMTIDGNKSNPLTVTVTVTEIPVTETFS